MDTHSFGKEGAPLNFKELEFFDRHLGPRPQRKPVYIDTTQPPDDVNDMPSDWAKTLLLGYLLYLVAIVALSGVLLYVLR